MTLENPDNKSGGRPTPMQTKELALLHLIHSGVNSSRLELARKTGLSPASITLIVKSLIDKGIVVERATTSSNVGRRPVPLEIRSDVAYLVGVDIGSYYLRVVITDMNGKIAYVSQCLTLIQEARDRVLTRAFRAVHRAIDESGLPKTAILGIGIAHSGFIDSDNGVVLSFPRPGQMTEWRNVPLQKLFQNEFAVPCLLEDSVRTIATAEKHFGLCKSLDDFLQIDVGMGIGAAIFFDGRLYRGAGGKAGEFGHITVDKNGPLCSCGNNGCLQAVASCAAIIEAVRTAINRGVDSHIQQLAGGDLDKVSIELIAQAAAANDSLAFRVLQEAASYIADGLADLVNLLNPKLIVFGGALFRAAPQLLSDPVRSIIKRRSLEKSFNDVQLQVSPLGSEAGALGASRLIAERVLEDVYFHNFQVKHSAEFVD
jgi:predicted NBD/HSP70 family sugar kinase